MFVCVHIAQVFIERDGEHEFVGLWSDVEGLNECEALPPEVIDCFFVAQFLL